MPGCLRLPKLRPLLAVALACATSALLVAAGTALAAAPANTAPPAVSGTAQLGGTLTTDGGTWSNATSLSYQWQRCGYAATVLGDSPRGYWRLGESSGTSLADASSNGNPGTYLNGVGLGATGALPGDANTSAAFDGTNDYVTISNSTSLNAPTTGLTIEAWVKPTSGGFGSTKPVVLKSFTSHNPPYYQYGLLMRDSPTKTVTLVLALGGSYTPVSANVTWTYGVWSHLAVTWNGATVRYYLNGTQVATASASGTLSTYATPLVFGAYNNLNKEPNYEFPGGLDEVAVYSVALQASQIADHYAFATGPCVDVGGATSQEYVPVSDDVGSTLRVRVTATNGDGSTVATSSETQAITPGGAYAPSNSALPTISGTATQGATLTSTNGTWSSDPAPSFAYEWRRCDANGANCSSIPGAGSATYAVVSADIGKTLRLAVTASNVAGSGTAVSNPTGVVGAAVAPANTALPTITPAAIANGVTLQAGVGTWSGSAPLSYAYQWRRCDRFGANCIDISGASSATYALSSASVGLTLRVVVTASNAAGTASATSSQTARVRAGAPETVEPYKNTAYDAQLAELLLAKWPNRYSTAEAQLSTTGPGLAVRRGLLRTRMAAKLLPDLQNLVLYNTVDQGWIVSRTIPGVGGDTKWVHLSADDLGLGHPQLGSTSSDIEKYFAIEWCAQATTYPVGSDTCQNTASYLNTYNAGKSSIEEQWVIYARSGLNPATQQPYIDNFFVDCSACPAGDLKDFRTKAYHEYGPDGAAAPNAELWECATPQGSGGPCDGASGRRWFRFIPASEMWERLRPDAFAVYASQTAAQLANAPNFTAQYPVDLAKARAVLDLPEMWAARNWISFELDPAPRNSARPGISGDATVGQTLTVDAGVWSGDDPKTFDYQWQRCVYDEPCEDISGETQTSYTLTDDDAYAELRVLVKAQNADGSSSSPSLNSLSISEGGDNASDPGAVGPVWPTAPDPDAAPSELPLEPIADSAATAVTDNSNLSGLPSGEKTANGVTFTNADGSWTIWSDCFPQQVGGRPNTLGPGYISRFVDNTGRRLVDDRRPAGPVVTDPQTHELKVHYTNGINAGFGGLGTFGFHEVRGTPGSVNIGGLDPDDPADTGTKDGHLIEGRVCASAQNEQLGVTHVDPIEGPVFKNVGGAKVGVYDVDVWLRDLCGVSTAADGVSIARVRYRWRFYATLVKLYAQVTMYPTGCTGTTFVKEPKFSAALLGEWKTDGPKFTRMVAFGGATGETPFDSKYVGEPPGNPVMHTQHAAENGRVRVQWDFKTETRTDPSPAHDDHQATPPGCSSATPCFNVVMRGYPSDTVGQEPSPWEAAPGRAVSDPPRAPVEEIGLDGWAERSAGACIAQPSRACANAFDSFGGQPENARKGTDCVPGNPDGQPAPETPDTNLNLIKRWETAGRKEAVTFRPITNPKPWKVSTVMFHGWEGGTGALDCEPLYRAAPPSVESWSVFATFGLNDNWAMR